MFFLSFGSLLYQEEGFHEENPRCIIGTHTREVDDSGNSCCVARQHPFRSVFDFSRRESLDTSPLLSHWMLIISIDCPFLGRTSRARARCLDVVLTRQCVDLQYTRYATYAFKAHCGSNLANTRYIKPYTQHAIHNVCQSPISRHQCRVPRVHRSVHEFRRQFQVPRVHRTKSNNRLSSPYARRSAVRPSSPFAHAVRPS